MRRLKLIHLISNTTSEELRLDDIKDFITSKYESSQQVGNVLLIRYKTACFDIFSNGTVHVIYRKDRHGRKVAKQLKKLFVKQVSYFRWEEKEIVGEEL